MLRLRDKTKYITVSLPIALASILLIIAVTVESYIILNKIFGKEPDVVFEYLPSEVIYEEILVPEFIPVTDNVLLEQMELAYENDLEALRNAIDERDATIRSLTSQISRATGSVRYIETIIESESSDCSINEVSDSLYLEFNDSDNSVTVPIGEVNITEEGQYTSSIYDSDIVINTTTIEESNNSLTLLTRLSWVNESGSYNLPYASTTYYNIDTHDASNPALDLPPRFRLWDPTVGLSINLDFSEPSSPYPSLYFATSTLRTKDRENRLFKFFQINLGISSVVNTVRPFAFGISPVAYNIGEPLPLLNDLWISAGVNFQDAFTNYSPFISIGTDF